VSLSATDRDSLDRTRLTIRQGPLVGPVLARVVGIHAARAPLPMDRLQDALLIADAIAARAPAYAISERLPVSLRAGDGQLELRIGPLREGGATRVLDGAEVAGAVNVVERLSDDVRVRPGSSGAEYLVIVLGDGEQTA
jgi:serine/threonine-protein kinase RsbW